MASSKVAVCYQFRTEHLADDRVYGRCFMTVPRYIWHAAWADIRVRGVPSTFLRSITKATNNVSVASGVSVFLPHIELNAEVYLYMWSLWRICECVCVCACECVCVCVSALFIFKINRLAYVIYVKHQSSSSTI